jgi:[Skp1-protein]-hydroxyproline N-acetylglucosaminyltransferase
VLCLSGAVDQVVDGDIGCLDIDIPCEEDPTQMICIYRSQIAVYKMDATLATGPVTARHVGDRMYRGEYFVMQMDAHCHFVEHWDRYIILQWKSTRNEMAVLR